MEKSIIFISHSNPEDNYFAYWLSVKLKQCGYEVWVDINDLKSGELWNRVHSMIRNKSIKFLACISKDYITKSKNEKTGVYKELVTASTVDLKDFIIPLMIDNSDWNDIPIHGLGFIGKNFSENWATGLRELLEVFEEEKIYKEEDILSLKNFWYEALKIECSPLEKEEEYYSNWFQIDEPKDIYLHRISSENKISQIPSKYCVVREDDIIVTFWERKILQKYVTINDTRKEDFRTFVKYDDGDYSLFGSKISKPNWKVIELLRKVFENFFTEGDFFSYEYSNRDGFFNKKKKNSVSLKHLGKTRKSISGTAFKNYDWFYGVSLNFATHPELFLKVSSRVIFKNNLGRVLGKEEQHTFRRKFCSNWYNRDWYELMLAFFSQVSDGSEYYSIPINTNKELRIKSIPLNFKTNYGYIEPNE